MRTSAAPDTAAVAVAGNARWYVSCVGCGWGWGCDCDCEGVLRSSTGTRVGVAVAELGGDSMGVSPRSIAVDAPMMGRATAAPGDKYCGGVGGARAEAAAAVGGAE